MKSFESFAPSIGFAPRDGVYVQEAEGFYIYLRSWQYMVLEIPSFFIPLDRALGKEELKKLEQAALNNACGKCSFASAGDALIITLPDGKKDSEKFAETCRKMIARVCKLLKAMEYHPMSLCPVCLQQGEYRRFGDHYLPCHDACIERYKQTLKEKADPGGKSAARYPVSMLLSLLFACIGALPALLCCLFAKGYFTGLIALIPIGSVAGYALGKAQDSRWIRWFSALLPTVLIIAFTAWSLPYLAAAKSLTFSEFLFAEGWKGLRKIIFSVLFCFGGFGGIRFLGKFRKDYGEELKKFE